MKLNVCIFLALSTMWTAHASKPALNLPGSEACAIQTCGEAHSLPSFSAPITAQDEHIYKTEIEPLINKYIQQELMTHDLQVFLIQKFANSLPTQMSNNARALMNLSIVMKYIDLSYDALTVVNGAYKLNTNKFKGNLISKGISIETDWLVESVRLFIESSTFLDFARWKNQPLEYLLKYNYPGKTLPDALALDAKKSGLTLQRMKESFPLLSTLIDNGEFDLIQKILRQEPINKAEKELYLSFRNQASLFKEILSGGSWHHQFLARKTSIPDDAKQILKNVLSLRGYQYKSWDSRIVQERTKVENKCKNSLTAALASSPTNRQVDNFKKDIIPNVIKSAGPLLSQDEKQIFNKTEFIMPKTRDEKIQYYKDYLQDMIVKSDRAYQLFLQMDPNEPAHQEAVYLTLSFANESETFDVLDEPGEFCEENGPEHIVDSALADFNIIHIGWRSVLFPHHGAGILAHELGHALSASEKKSPRFSNIMSCLQKNQNGKEQFVEEDFADLFASKVMAQQSSNSNYACLMLNQSGQKFSHLNFSPQSDDSKHSSSFLRLINIGSYIQSTAPACQSLQKSWLAITQWKDCWQ